MNTAEWMDSAKWLEQHIKYLIKYLIIELDSESFASYKTRL